MLELFFHFFSALDRFFYGVPLYLICALLVAPLSATETGTKTLKIGLLRHLTIEEAEARSIDTQAEQLIIAESMKRGHQITMINPMAFVCETASSKSFDVIISRAEMDSFSDPVTDSYLRALDYFQTLGVPVINSSAATLSAQDKFRTLMLAKNAGVRVPETFLVYRRDDIEQLLALGRINYPFFVKQPYSGCGKGVFLVKNARDTQVVLQKFQPSEPILVEERIDLETDARGNVRDMRVWVVRDAVTNRAKFLGAVYRTASNKHYLTNTYAGGTVSPLEKPYDPALIRLAEQALESIGADVAGVDIGRDKAGNLYLIEINISFFTGKVFLDTIGINIWSHVMDLAEARAKKGKSAQGWPVG